MFFRIADRRQSDVAVAEALVELQRRRLTAPDQPWVNAVTQAALHGLALEAVHYCINCVGLEGLNFESEFHG